LKPIVEADSIMKKSICPYPTTGRDVSFFIKTKRVGNKYE